MRIPLSRDESMLREKNTISLFKIKSHFCERHRKKPRLISEKEKNSGIMRAESTALHSIVANPHSRHSQNRFLSVKVSPAARHLQHFKAPSCNFTKCSAHHWWLLPPTIHVEKKVVNAQVRAAAVAKMSFATHTRRGEKRID
jgi:hypothetical protein